MGKAWQQQCEPAGWTASITRKQREVHAGPKLNFSQDLSLWDQQVFPSQLNFWENSHGPTTYGHRYVSWVTLNPVKWTREIIHHSQGGPLPEHRGLLHLQGSGLGQSVLLHRLQSPPVFFSELWLGAPPPLGSLGFWLQHYLQFRFQTLNMLLKNKYTVPRPSVLRLVGWMVRRESMEMRAGHTSAFTWERGASFCLPGREELPAPASCPHPAPAQAFLEGQEQCMGLSSPSRLKRVGLCSNLPLTLIARKWPFSLCRYELMKPWWPARRDCVSRTVRQGGSK